jgi:hypothetical protein
MLDEGDREFDVRIVDVTAVRATHDLRAGRESDVRHHQPAPVLRYFAAGVGAVSHPDHDRRARLRGSLERPIDAQVGLSAVFAELEHRADEDLVGVLVLPLEWLAVTDALRPRGKRERDQHGRFDRAPHCDHAAILLPTAPSHDVARFW